MSTRQKYPRTSHLPWSPGAGDDDIRNHETTAFEGRKVVVTEKMDGENTTLYCDYIHARSLDSGHHASRDWVKQWHGGIAHNIPKNFRVCGENLFAQHSVKYDALKSFFYGFSVWNEQNYCCSWADTLEWFEMLEIHPVPVLYSGLWNEKIVRELKIDSELSEGYVVRLADSFKYEEFSTSVAKWVRKGHVQTDKHWMHSEIEPNKLKPSKNE